MLIIICSTLDLQIVVVPKDANFKTGSVCIGTNFQLSGPLIFSKYAGIIYCFN